MQVTRIFRNSFVIAFLLFNFCSAVNANAQLAASERMDNIAGIALAASGVALPQQKSVFSLVNADKLDSPAAVDEAAAEVEQEAIGNRQTRQVIYPYGGYGRYYGGYPYYYPYSYYTYRPYYYYRPIYSYGLPFYLYG